MTKNRPRSLQASVDGFFNSEDYVVSFRIISYVIEGDDANANIQQARAR